MKEVISIVKDENEDKSALFWCEGCGMAHAPKIESKTRPLWSWNGSKEKPTFKPSILVRYVSTPEVIEKDEDDNYILGTDGRIKGAKNEVCHSFVTNGEIKYLNDCTHKLKGQTIKLKPF